MSRRSLLVLLAIPVFFLAAIPAFASSHRAKRAAAPVVKSVHPLKLKIGEKLTIRGSGFIKGRHKDTVVFMGAGKRVVWVRADKATTRTIVVTLPVRLAVLLADKSGAQKPTRLLVRVIARRSARSFTKRAKSPIVSPNASIQSGTPQAEPCPGYSDANADSDGDFLSNGLELALGTNPCKADSDGDGVTDGYEYQAALDLNRNANSAAIPWPSASKRPYPNPLDPSDANTDFDGDSLTLFEEYEASFAWGLGIDPAHKLQTFLPYAPNPNPNNDVMVVSYSDGDQTTNASVQGNPIGDPTGPAAPCSPGQGPTTQSGFDVNGNGTIGDNGDVLSYQAASGSFVDSATTPLGWMNSWNPNRAADCFLSDDEKDIDGDGLSNFTEAHGPLSGQKWWNALVPKDGTYPVSFDGTNWLNADSDGDGILDGSDDQDHDGYTNIEESMPQSGAQNPDQSKSVWHYPVENVFPNVNAFNPCLPNNMSPACPRHPNVGDTYAPIPPDSPQSTFNTWPRPAP